MSTPLNTKQQGLALILFLVTALTVAGGSFFITAQRIKNSSIQTDHKTYKALAAAKQALVSFSLSYQPTGLATELGRLPYPDRFLDGDYDGQSDCINYTDALNLPLLIGRFPWLRERGACPAQDINFDLKDALGERLWYAVSPHMVRHSSNATFSPNFLAITNQWLTLYDQNGLVSDRIAFIAFSAGAALPGQNKNTSTPINFLDSYNVPGIGNVSNHDNDLTFVTAPKSETFNDKLIYMTIDELMPLLEKRVLLEVRNLLNNFQNLNGYYPYPAALIDPFYNCDTTISPGGGFIATSNVGPNLCPPALPPTPNSFIPLGNHLAQWQPYIIYEPRQDCIFTNRTGCGNQPNGLTVDGINTGDFILMSPGLYTLPPTNNRANYFEDAINIVDDQIYVRPNPQLSNDQLIFQ